MLRDAFVDNITVTILVGYGDWDNNAETGITTGAEGGDLNGLDVSYSSLKAALASHETSALDQTFVNSLQSTASVNGVSTFYVPSAVDKALGLLSPTNSTVDGAVGMGTQIPSNLQVGVALHELTDAMGREPGVGPFDLFRYTSPGNHLFGGPIPAPPAYFSIDGGYTKLADFDRRRIRAISSIPECQGPSVLVINVQRWGDVVRYDPGAEPDPGVARSFAIEAVFCD